MAHPMVHVHDDDGDDDDDMMMLMMMLIMMVMMRHAMYTLCTCSHLSCCVHAVISHVVVVEVDLEVQKIKTIVVQQLLCRHI